MTSFVRTGADRLPTLMAKRVHLRWLTGADERALFQIFSDPQVTQYWSSPPAQQVSDMSDLIDQIHSHFARDGLYEWGVALRDSDRVIGTCSLASLDFSNRRAELGFALSREFWRQGLMSEAVGAVLEFAFEQLNLRRLEADVDPRNTASIGLLQRFGFQREGFLRERWLVGDEIADTVFFGLLRREWQAMGEQAREKYDE